MANIPAELRALPLGHLIGSPLKAAIESQALAAMTTVKFIREVGLKESAGGAGTEAGGPTEAVTVDFKYTRYIETRDQAAGTTTITPQAVTLTVPILSIVPIPYIRISDMTIDFEFQIKDTETTNTSSEMTANVKAKASYWFFSVEVNASYTNKSETKRSTDRSTTFRIHVNAVQDEVPGGLGKVLDLLQAAIVPRP